jgi:hypothetical protein
MARPPRVVAARIASGSTEKRQIGDPVITLGLERETPMLCWFRHRRARQPDRGDVRHPRRRRRMPEVRSARCIYRGCQRGCLLSAATSRQEQTGTGGIDRVALKPAELLARLGAAQVTRGPRDGACGCLIQHPGGCDERWRRCAAADPGRAQWHGLLQRACGRHFQARDPLSRCQKCEEKCSLARLLPFSMRLLPMVESQDCRKIRDYPRALGDASGVWAKTAARMQCTSPA